LASMGSNNVFDFFQAASLEDGAPAGHHAIQFIRQWAAAAFRAGTTISFEGLLPPQRDLAQRIVAEIEAREGRPVRQISQDRINEYIRVLSDQVQALSRKQFHVDPNKGRDLLGRLRTIK
jgi:hypothetical protein